MENKPFHYFSISSILILSIFFWPKTNSAANEITFGGGWIGQLRTALFIASPPDIFTSSELIHTIRNTRDVRYTDSLDQVLEALSEKMASYDPSLKQDLYYFSVLEKELEVAILDLTLLKEGKEESKAQVDFLLERMVSRGVESDDEAVEWKLLKERATLFTAALFEKMDSREQDWYSLRIIPILRYSSAPDLEQGVLSRIDDYQHERMTYSHMLNVLSMRGGTKSFAYLRNTYRKGERRIQYACKHALKNLNNYSKDSVLKTEVKAFLAAIELEEKEAREAQALAAEQQQEAEPRQPSFSRPEDRGEDLSGQSTAALLLLFKGGDLGDIYTDPPFHKNEKAIALRKAANILGDRDTEGQLDLLATDRELIKKVVAFYLDLSKQDNPHAFEEGATQIQRLWHLGVPTLLENIAGNDDRRRQAASQFILDMRDESLTKKIVEIAKGAKEQRAIRWYAAILRGMKNPPQPLYRKDQVLNRIDTERIFEEVVRPVLKRLESIKE